MKYLTVIVFIVLIFSGGMAAFYGFKSENSLLAGLGLAACGVGIFIVGVVTIIERESVEEEDSGYVNTYRGYSAIFVGATWTLLGMIAFIIGLIVLVRQQKSMTQWMTEHPGLAFIAIGLVLLAFGGRELLGSEEQRGSFLSVLGSLPARLFGLLLMIVGLILLAAGVLEILLPATYQGIITSIQFWWKEFQCQIQPAYCID